ncbi:hypothetical protein GYMLUDRAFT_93758 [Collybiopsis luxurians FD-317 M1]|nr:hypothetical protein GYMLUDRAFT_93758 [Collybiopsis luxurians FD-317 M1]
MSPSFIPDPLPPFNINSSVGAFEIGTLVAVLLFGATTVQSYLYYERYPKDHKLIKFMVASVWLLELGHTICICHALYTMTISWYAQPQLLAVPPVSLDLSILINAFIGPVEQAWFTRRLYVFSKNLWLTAICCLLSFARLIASVAYSAVALQRLNIVVFELKYWWILTIIVVLGSVNDLILACSLGWYLYMNKKKNVARVAKLLDRLILWAVETSAITTVATVAMMICFFTMPWNFIYIAVYVCLAKVYANALLASLNAREVFSQRFGEVMTLEHLSNSSRSRPFSQPVSYRFRSQFSDEGQIASPGLISDSFAEEFDRYDPESPREDIAWKKFPVTVRVERESEISGR